MATLQRSSLEAYLFALVGISAAAFPMTWYLRAILVVVMAGIIIDLIIRSPWTAKWQWRPKAFAAAAALSLLGAAAWRPIADDYRGAELPDVALRLVYPESPSLVLENLSGAIARDIKWSPAIWSVDEVGAVAANSGIDPLPIPVSTFDVLRPHASGGPQALFLQFEKAARIKAGTRIMGSISVICPTCSRGHTYFVSIVWGNGGWYAELPDIVEGNIAIPPKLKRENLEKYFAMIEETPNTSRHAIKPLF